LAASFVLGVRALKRAFYSVSFATPAVFLKQEPQFWLPAHKNLAQSLRTGADGGSHFVKPSYFEPGRSQRENACGPFISHPSREKADGRYTVGFSLQLPAQASGAIAMSLSLHRSG
jgi:hypothetical protein